MRVQSDDHTLAPFALPGLSDDGTAEQRSTLDQSHASFDIALSDDSLVVLGDPDNRVTNNILRLPSDGLTLAPFGTTLLIS